MDGRTPFPGRGGNTRNTREERTNPTTMNPSFQSAVEINKLHLDTLVSGRVGQDGAAMKVKRISTPYVIQSFE